MNVNAYYNGEFKHRDEIRIPLTDRALFFGDGIYDAAIGRNGKIFMLDEHIDRFLSNAAAIDIPLPCTRTELKRILLKTVMLSGETTYFVYFQLSRFSEERVHAAPPTEKSNILVTVSPFKLFDKNKRLRLITYEDIRHGMCNVKTLNLVPAVLSSKNAAEAGADEAVFVRNGIVTECSHSNIHIVKRGKIITHPLDRHILPGISRMHMLSVCDRLSIPYEERKFPLSELMDADEVLVTSSSKLALSAFDIDGKIYDNSESDIAQRICKRMRDDFLAQTL